MKKHDCCWYQRRKYGTHTWHSIVQFSTKLIIQRVLVLLLWVRSKKDHQTLCGLAQWLNPDQSKTYHVDLHSMTEPTCQASEPPSQYNLHCICRIAWQHDISFDWTESILKIHSPKQRHFKHTLNPLGHNVQFFDIPNSEHCLLHFTK